MSSRNVLTKVSRAALVSGGAGALLAAAVGSASAADLPAPPPIIASPIVVEPANVPKFYVSLSALFMTRNNGADVPILTSPDTIEPLSLVGENTTEGSLWGSDLDYGWSFGFAARAGMIGDPIGFDVGGFWLRPLQSHVDVYGDYFWVETDPYLPWPGEDPYEADGAEAWGTTWLHGADANATFSISDAFQLFAGAAYVKVKDDLQVNIYSPEGTTSDFNWTTFNRLLGPQIGVRGSFGDTFTVGVEGRLAYLFNSATGYASIDDDDGGILFENVTDSAKDRTLMLAGGINLGWHISENVSLNIGYQAMWFRNLALAPAQVGATDPVAPSLTLDTSSSLLVHGIQGGFTFQF